jgi:hypothetical protein
MKKVILFLNVINLTDRLVSVDCRRSNLKKMSRYRAFIGQRKYQRILLLTMEMR